MQAKESLDAQMTNLLHMQCHYKRIAKARATVDTWHYGPNSDCYHSYVAFRTGQGQQNARKRTGRMLPIERMHMILSDEIPSLKSEAGFRYQDIRALRRPSTAIGTYKRE